VWKGGKLLLAPLTEAGFNLTKIQLLSLAYLWSQRWSKGAEQRRFYITMLTMANNQISAFIRMRIAGKRLRVKG
jgi:hypothetical protein